MPKKRAAIKKRPRGGERLGRVGRDVVAGLKEAIGHAKGEIKLPTREYEVPGPVNAHLAGLGDRAIEASQRRPRLPDRDRAIPADRRESPARRGVSGSFGSRQN